MARASSLVAACIVVAVLMLPILGQAAKIVA